MEMGLEELMLRCDIKVLEKCTKNHIGHSRLAFKPRIEY